MVNGQLVAAMDWRKKKGEKHGTYSYLTGETWHVVTHGPGYSNTHMVTAYDDEGLQWLLRHERKEETGAKDKAVQP